MRSASSSSPAGALDVVPFGSNARRQRRFVSHSPLMNVPELSGSELRVLQFLPSHRVMGQEAARRATELGLIHPV